MKTIIHAKNFSLNKEQEDFINEKVVKIRELSKTLNDESHEINIDFEYTESQKKSDQITCVATVNLKWHQTERVSKNAETVEKAFAEVKKVLIEDIKKIKWKKSWVFWKIKKFFKK